MAQVEDSIVSIGQKKEGLERSNETVTRRRSSPVWRLGW
jgi:hypothetical protein